MPIISKLVGKGVALGAEYREHRKDVKLSRENSQQSVAQIDGGASSSSSPCLSRNVSAAGPADAPPSYTEASIQSGDRSVASGPRPSDDKKAALAQYDEDEDDSSDEELSTEDDEADWELDEAMDSKEDLEPPEYRPIDELVHDVMTASHGPPGTALPANFERTPLPCPVILPQRRPRKKERGFVRAYAPLLGECSGIDQATFLSFLENFHRSSQASPVWPVIQISAAIAGLAPSPIAMAVTTAVQIAAGTAKEIQSRHRTNDFLDKINDELFKPAGLFAMIVKYKTPDEVARSENSLFAKLGVSAQHVDFSTGQAVAKYERSLSDESAGGKSMSDRMKNIRLASGTTRGAIELPEAAPLVFPEVDQAIAANGPETFKDRAKDAKAFMADYLDRRAQMQYTNQDPNSSLAVPEDKRTMKSKYSDPNHPMYSGGLVALVSGGHMGKRVRSRSPNAYASTAPRRPGLYDSSRLYSSASGLSARDVRRNDRDERRALRTEQRLAEGRRVGRKRERRYEGFLAERERMYGGDEGMGARRRGRGRGPIGTLVGFAGTAIESSRQGTTANPSAPHAPYGESSAPAPYGGNAPAPHGSSSSGAPANNHGAGRRTAYAGGADGRVRQGRGPLGMVKRIMTEDVLYLMIVNMPSEAELAEAREAIAAAKNSK